MGNHTVKEKIGKAAGKNDIVRITGTKIIQEEKGLQVEGVVDRVDLLKAGEFISIKAYKGGNPNKILAEKPTKRREEIIH